MSSVIFVKGKDLKPGDVVQLVNKATLQINKNDTEREIVTCVAGKEISYSPYHTFKIVKP